MRLSIINLVYATELPVKSKRTDKGLSTIQGPPLVISSVQDGVHAKFIHVAPPPMPCEIDLPLTKGSPSSLVNASYDPQ